MRKLIIVGTRATTGKGGISTALSGYLNGLSAKNIDYEFVESHWQGTPIFVSWFSAFISIFRLAIKHRGNAVFWFHLGPWLSMSRKFSLAILPRLFGSDTIAHIHSPAMSSYLNGGFLVRLLTKLSLLPFNKIVVLTPWWQSFLHERGITKPSFISANPINQAYYQIASSYIDNPRTAKDKKDHIEILTMARIAEGKNIDVVIEAVSRLPENMRLTIAGDGPLLEKYRKLVRELGLDERIRFTGWIDGEKKEQLLRKSDIFCLPSTYDSFGMVFIEAMAFDIPVIAYGWGPINDVVTNDVGVCCQAPLTENVVDAINTVVAQLALYTGKGPAKVIAQYSPEKITNKFVDFLALDS
ncbi:glycosyltransferase family 4 protein [Colwelliaceae bacterium 6471]